MWAKTDIKRPRPKPSAGARRRPRSGPHLLVDIKTFTSFLSLSVSTAKKYMPWSLLLKCALAPVQNMFVKHVIKSPSLCFMKQGLLPKTIVVEFWPPIVKAAGGLGSCPSENLVKFGSNAFGIFVVVALQWKIMVVVNIAQDLNVLQNQIV